MAIVNMGAGGLNLNYLFEISDTPPWETSDFQSPKPILWLKDKLEYLNKYNDTANYVISQKTIRGYKHQTSENSEAKPDNNSANLCNTKLALEPTISLDAEYPTNRMFYQATDTKKPYIQLGFPITETKTTFTGGFFNQALKNTTADGVSCDYLFRISCQLKPDAAGNLAPNVAVETGHNLFVLNDKDEVDYQMVTITVSKVTTTFIVVYLDINYEIVNGFIKSYIIESSRALAAAEQCRFTVGGSTFLYPGEKLTATNWAKATKISTIFLGKIVENSIIADVSNKINLAFIPVDSDCTAFKITTYDNSEYQLFTFDDETLLQGKNFEDATVYKLLDLEGQKITLYDKKEYQFNDAHNTIVVLPPYSYTLAKITNEEEFIATTGDKYILENDEYEQIDSYDADITEYYTRQKKQFLGIQYSTNISETIPIIENYSDNYSINAQELQLKELYNYYEFNEEKPVDLDNENHKALWIKIGNNSKINLPIINNPLKPHYIEIQSAIIKIGNYYYYLNGYVYDNINKNPIPLNTNDYTAVSLKDLIEGTVTEIESDKINTVTSYMFYQYEALKSVNFPSCTKILTSAFRSCKNLTDVYLPKWNSNAQFVTGSTSDSSPFAGCTAIQRATIGFLSVGATTVTNASSTTAATKAYNPFNSAKRALKQLNMPSCSNIGGSAFKGYTVLHDVELGGERLEIQTSAFDGCVNLKNISLGPSPKSIGTNAFLNCTSLYSVENLEAVETFAANAFVKCYSLKTDPSNPLLATTFGNAAFNSCTNLRYFIAPNCSKIQSTSATLPFQSCKNLEVLSMPSVTTVTGISTNTFPRVLTYASFPYLSYCDLAGISKVAASGFTGLSNLSYIRLSNNYVTVASSTFSNCTCIDPYLANYDLIKDKWEQYEFMYEIDENENPVYGFSKPITETEEDGTQTTVTQWYYRDPDNQISTKIQYETTPIDPKTLSTFIESSTATNVNRVNISPPADEEETIDGVTYQIRYDNVVRKTTTVTDTQTVIKYNPNTLANNENDWLYKYTREKVAKEAKIEGIKHYYYPMSAGPLGGTEYKNEPYNKPDPNNSPVEYFIYAANSAKIKVDSFSLDAEIDLIAQENNNLIPAIEIRKDHIQPVTSTLTFQQNEAGKPILNQPVLYMAKYNTEEKLLVKEKDSNGDPVLNSNGQFIYIAGGYKGLKYINNPDNPDEGLIAPNITTIHTQAFAGCSNLTEVYLNATDGVIGQNAFQNCINLQEIHAINFKSIDTTTFNNCNNLRIMELTNVALSSSAKSATAANIQAMFCPYSKSSKAFIQKFTNLQTLELQISTTLPNPATSSGIKGLGLFENYPLAQAAFNNCTVIGSSAFKNTQFSYINVNWKKVQGTEQLKQGPNQFGNIHIPVVTTINNCAFANCSLLQGGLLKEVHTIGNQAFENCINITQINNSRYGDEDILNVPKVQTIGEKAFAGLTNLSLVKLPNTITNIKTLAFENCNSLQELEIDENVNTNLTIGSSAFLNNKLTTLKLPFQLYSENCPATHIAIAADAFKRETEFDNNNPLIVDLTNFDRGDDNEVIPSWGFWTCVNIANQVFGSNVKFRLKQIQYNQMPSSCTWNTYYSNALTMDQVIIVS